MDRRGAHDALHPAIAISKTVDPPNGPSGFPITSTITVTNVGDVPLTGVTVADPLVPVCERTGLSLPTPGGSVSYTCPFVAPTDSFVNMATATGVPPSGLVVTNTASVGFTATNPELRVVKTVDQPVARPGDPLVFHIAVSNVGDVDLTTVVVDPALPGCDRTIGALPVGATFEYDCFIAAQFGTTVNTAVATGTPDVGRGGSVCQRSRLVYRALRCRKPICLYGLCARPDDQWECLDDNRGCQSRNRGTRLSREFA